jgi:tellurite methyltransferase
VFSCCEKVRPGNSARMFRNPAPVLRNLRVKRLLKSHKEGTVLELGAGCLRNALFLQKLGFKVSVVEVGEMESRFPSRYRKLRLSGGKILKKIPRGTAFDIILATFVIETICDRQIRKCLVSQARKHLRPKGSFVLSVRGPADLVTARARGIRCSDGYVTSGHTFARSFTRAQLHSFLRACGFGRIEFLHKKGTKEPELLHVIAEE